MNTTQQDSSTMEMSSKHLERQFFRLNEIIAKHTGANNSLIAILQEVQQEYRYLPAEVISYIATTLNLSPATVFGVASFYAQFRFTPVGRNHIMVCRGTACHVKGTPEILSALEGKLGIKEGETTADMEYTLETVGCIGACGLAPCITINHDVHGRLTLKDVVGLIDSRGKEGQNV